MSAIWKYEFSLNDTVTFDMPRGAEIVHVDSQRDVPCMWALVNPKAPRERREFRVCGTGHEIDTSKWKHLATFQSSSEFLVWHVFEPRNVIKDLLG